MTITDLHALSRIYPSIRDLPAGLCEAWSRGAQAVHVPASRVLFDVGRPADHLPLIASGLVRVVRRMSSGREVLLYRAGPGDFCVLTMAALLGDAPYEATGIVESSLDAVIVPKPLVERLVEQHAPLRRAMFSTMAVRLSRLMTLVEEVAVSRLDQRLAALPVRHAPALRATHQHLADELATAREVVSRILESFELSGLVRLHRGRVDIVDPHRLGDLAKDLGDRG